MSLLHDLIVLAGVLAALWAGRDCLIRQLADGELKRELVQLREDVDALKEATNKLRAAVRNG